MRIVDPFGVGGWLFSAVEASTRLLVARVRTRRVHAALREHPRCRKHLQQSDPHFAGNPRSGWRHGALSPCMEIML